MGRKATSKALCLYIERILLAYTDELGDEASPHALSVTQIQGDLKKHYEIDVSTDLVRQCLEAIDEFYSAMPLVNSEEPQATHAKYLDSAYQLEQLTCKARPGLRPAKSKAQNTKKLYQLVNVQLQLSSLKHILALIQRASHAGDAHNIIDEVLASRSTYERQMLQADYAGENARPSEALKLECVLFDVDTIENAIQNHELLSFDYEADKPARGKASKAAKGNAAKPTQEGDKQYVDMVPYCVALDDGYYYLYCKKLGFRRRDFRILRVDKIRDLSSKKLASEYDWPKNYEELQALAQRQVRASVNRMPDRKMVMVTLRCHDKKSERYIKDNFGDKEGYIYLGGSPSDKGSDYRFTASFDGMKYWVLKHISSYEVLEPKELRDAIKEEIQHNCYGLTCVDNED